VSIGVSAFPEDGRTGAVLMERADAALYAAKADGRDRVAISGVKRTETGAAG
jgi:GGDEF domain-containing protein